MNMFVPSLLTVGGADAEAAARSKDKSGRAIAQADCPGRVGSYLLVLLANALLFSVLGGALLTRYLLPMYPLVLLVAVSTFHRRVPYWQALAASRRRRLSRALFINPPYRFAPEDNLEYARVIRLHMAGNRAAEQALSGFNGSVRVAGDGRADAAGAGLREGCLCRCTGSKTFTCSCRSSARPTSRRVFDRAGVLDQVRSSVVAAESRPRSEALDEKYFGLHHDLPPEAIALRLHGSLVWQREDHGIGSR